MKLSMLMYDADRARYNPQRRYKPHVVYMPECRSRRLAVAAPELFSSSRPEGRSIQDAPLQGQPDGQTLRTESRHLVPADPSSRNALVVHEANRRRRPVWDDRRE